MGDERNEQFIRQAKELKDRLRALGNQVDQLFKAKVGSNLEQLLNEGSFVTSWLESSDPQQRVAALCALSEYWDPSLRKGFMPWFERLAKEDINPEVRLTAISALGAMHSGTSDLPIMNLLARFVSDSEEEEEIRKAAYLAMLAIGNTEGVLLPSYFGFTFPNDVNWELVDSYLPSGPSVE